MWIQAKWGAKYCLLYDVSLKLRVIMILKVLKWGLKEGSKSIAEKENILKNTYTHKTNSIITVILIVI